MQDDNGQFTLASRLARWAVLLFLAYVLISNSPKFGIGITPPAPEASQQTSQNILPPAPKAAKDCDCSGSAFSNFSLLTMPFAPVSSPRLAIADVKEGSGEPAVCGQRATLRYTYATRGGDVIFSNMESGEPTKNITIGGGEMLKGFERGLIGMKAGGERNISIPLELGFDPGMKSSTLRDFSKFNFPGSVDAVISRASLLSLSPEAPRSAMKPRIAEQQFGSGAPAECGDTVYITLSVWKLDGTLAYTNETTGPLKVTLGRSQLPFGIEQGIEGMMLGSLRTLIIPPEYAAPLVADAPGKLLPEGAVPQDQILMAAVQLVNEPKKPEAKPEPAKEKAPAKPQPAPKLAPKPKTEVTPAKKDEPETEDN